MLWLSVFADNDFLKCTPAHKVLSIKRSTGRLRAVQTERKSPGNRRVHTNDAVCDNVATAAGQGYSELLCLFKEILAVVVFFLDSSHFLAGRSWIQLRHGLFPPGGEVGPSARPAKKGAWGCRTESTYVSLPAALHLVRVCISQQCLSSVVMCFLCPREHPCLFTLVKLVWADCLEAPIKTRLGVRPELSASCLVPVWYATSCDVWHTV